MTKDIIKSIKFSDEEYEFLSIAAKENNMSFSSYIRHAAINFSIQNDMEEAINEELSEITSEPKKMILDLLKENTQILSKTIETMSNNISRENDKIHNLLDLLIYIYFYHTPEVPEDLKNEANRSALTRKKKLPFLNKKLKELEKEQWTTKEELAS